MCNLTTMHDSSKGDLSSEDCPVLQQYPACRVCSAQCQMPWHNSSQSSKAAGVLGTRTAHIMSHKQISTSAQV